MGKNIHSSFYFVTCLCIASASAVCMLVMKNKVKELTKELSSINQLIAFERESMHILTAEMSFLSNPKRIKAIADKNLDLRSPQKHQIMKIKDLNAYFASIESKEIEGNMHNNE